MYYLVILETTETGLTLDVWSQHETHKLAEAARTREWNAPGGRELPLYVFGTDETFRKADYPTLLWKLRRQLLGAPDKPVFY